MSGNESIKISKQVAIKHKKLKTAFLLCPEGIIIIAVIIIIIIIVYYY